MEDYPEKEELEDVSLDELSEYTEDQPLLLGMVMSLFMVFQPKKGRTYEVSAIERQVFVSC